MTAAGASASDAYWDLVTTDISHATDILRPYYDEWDGGDGFVSVEVSPDLAHDADGTIAQAKELWTRLDRPNVMIKIPATAEGIPAISAALDAGLNVNVTLIFSLDRYAEVVSAFFEGLERRVARGDDISRVASVASFFVSRVDTETDRRLPDDHPLRGRAAVANAKLAYQHFLATFAGARWDALAAKGARVQRPLWASTSTKNPAYSPTLYVDTLIGERHGQHAWRSRRSTCSRPERVDLRAETVLEGLDEARATMDGLAAFGVDFDDVTATLEREGVASFAASFKDAVDTLEKKARELK